MITPSDPSHSGASTEGSASNPAPVGGASAGGSLMAITPLREQTIEALSTYFAADRLTLDEFEHRVAAAYMAPTPQALQELVVDLAPPPSPEATTAMTILPAGAPVAADAVRVAPVLGAPMAEQSLSVLLGNHERNGVLTVPARLHVRCVLGNVELDLRDATFTAPVTDIIVDAVLGNVEITVPSNVRVESHGNAVLGSFESRTRKGVDPNSPADVVLRVSGSSVLASVEVRRVATTHGGHAPLLAPPTETTPAIETRTDPQRLLQQRLL